MVLISLTAEIQDDTSKLRGKCAHLYFGQVYAYSLNDVITRKL